jgi:hypothetical protein
MSLVADSVQTDGIKGGRYAQGRVELVLNARVMAAPTMIRKVMESSLRQASAGIGAEVVSYSDSVIRPVPEKPDHFHA